jgi:AraC-like DNA-binding protein
MIKTILLLTPVYVTLFWSILLNFQNGKQNSAKRFLGKFMVACVVVYLTHFLYFSNLQKFVPMLEPIYQLASLSVYPLFYIYFRLLFMERSFSIRKHGVYLLTPILISLIYLALSATLPKEVFVQWLYHLGTRPNDVALKFLNILNIIIPVVYVGQVLFTVTANLSLINSHRKKAGNYFADFYEIRTLNVVILNVVLIVCGIASITLSILGRGYFISEMLGIFLASLIFSTMLFTIGWIGFRQNAVNPTFDEEQQQPSENLDDSPLDNRQQLMERITKLFRMDRIHLNTKLTIQDVAKSVGTNRTYVSSIINQHYGVNFCTFVNNFRIEELEHLLKSHPELTNQLLAESCGFGSVDSLKRAVNAKTGLSVTQWKNNLTKKPKK